MSKSIDKARGLKLHDGELAQVFVSYARFVESQASSHRMPTGNIGEAVESSVLINVIVAEIRRIGDLVATRRPDLGSEAVRDFRILMAAWADEVLIRLGVVDNGGVETALCNTANAGETFFQLVERIVDRRNANDISLGAICLLMLLMGFQGHYIGNAGLIRLRHYIEALRAIAASEKAVTALVAVNVVDVATKISATTHMPTGIVRWVPSVKLTVSVFAALLLIVMSALSAHWLSISASLEQGLHRATEGFSASIDSSGGDR